VRYGLLKNFFPSQRCVKSHNLWLRLTMLPTRCASLLFLVFAAVQAFQLAVSPSSSRAVAFRRYGYVPDGLSKQQWEKMKRDEEAKRKKRDFGKAGARGFESRSMQSFVAALEKGEAKHLMYVVGAIWRDETAVAGL